MHPLLFVILAVLAQAAEPSPTHKPATVRTAAPVVKPECQAFDTQLSDILSRTGQVREKLNAIQKGRNSNPQTILYKMQQIARELPALKKEFEKVKEAILEICKNDPEIRQKINAIEKSLSGSVEDFKDIEDLLQQAALMNMMNRQGGAGSGGSGGGGGGSKSSSSTNFTTPKFEVPSPAPMKIIPPPEQGEIFIFKPTAPSDLSINLADTIASDTKLVPKINLPQLRLRESIGRTRTLTR